MVSAALSFPRSILLIIALELKVSALGLLFLTSELIPFFKTGIARANVDSVL